MIRGAVMRTGTSTSEGLCAAGCFFETVTTRLAKGPVEDMQMRRGSMGMRAHGRTICRRARSGACETYVHTDAFFESSSAGTSTSKTLRPARGPLARIIARYRCICWFLMHCIDDFRIPIVHCSCAVALLRSGQDALDGHSATLVVHGKRV